MIPIKIISKEEAVSKGLANYENDERGEGVAGAGWIATGKKGSKIPDKILEKVLFKKNGKKELVFMHEDRKKEMIERNKLPNYLDQFDKIEGKEKGNGSN